MVSVPVLHQLPNASFPFPSAQQPEQRNDSEQQRQAVAMAALNQLSQQTDGKIQRFLATLDVDWAMGLSTAGIQGHASTILEMLVRSWIKHYAPHGLDDQKSMTALLELVQKIGAEYRRNNERKGRF